MSIIGQKIFTCVYGCHEALDNHGRQTIETGQLVYDLLESAEFAHHVQKERNQGHSGQVQCSNDAVAFPSPFCEDEAMGALSANNGSEVTKGKQG